MLLQYRTFLLPCYFSSLTFSPGHFHLAQPRSSTMSAHRIAPILLALAATALAKTDLAGCTSFTTTTAFGDSAPFQTIMWYVPDNLEICSFLDCGGGRAPPKTDTPGCPQYTGTEPVAVAFLATDPAAPPPAPSTSAPTPTESERGGTSSPRPTGPPEEEGASTTAAAGSETVNDTAATQSTSRTGLIVAPSPTPSPSTAASASASESAAADPSSTGAADALRGGPGFMLAAGLAAIAVL
ncbi:putative siderophore biosynthesis enzyme [Plectosphaerella plurivora]|uniref:Siderophore biosynthesis enzyme n=1 Tax=Plectosphaerella plurivora TaxID=936078 RepID=A0A9P9ABI0_9PEZI|nr:putative siderophore biosynthesis enzyme [Plectosphaerella plurivora]